MSKMFVHYSGNKAAFAATRNDAGKLLSEVYNNYIVFIKGEAGECIYTHGAYYGDVKAAIAALEGRMSTAEGKIQANDDAIAVEKGRVDGIVADYLKAADKTELNNAINGKVAQSAYDAKMSELAKADTDNLAAAKTYANSLAGNYEAAGAAAAALASAKEYTDALANGAVTTNAANIKTNQDDIDAIEAYINNPWEEVNA